MIIENGYNDGVTNATPAFQRVYDLPGAGQTIRCEVPRGMYKLDSQPIPGAGKVIWEFEPGATITGASLPYVVPTQYQGTHTGPGLGSSVVGGAVQRIVSPMVPEDSVLMVSTDNYGGSTIWPEDAVLVHFKATNTDATPRTWTQNNNIVKQSMALDNYSCAFEISVQNQTSEVGVPNASGCLQGMFISYINHGGSSNYASAALVIGGTGASADSGFKHGVWIDNITTGGNAITLKNGGANAMDAGLDTRGVTGSFGSGAVALGNGHRVVSKNPVGDLKGVVCLDSAGYLQISDVGVPVVLNGNGLLMPDIPTVTSATAGAASALPATPSGYLVVAIAGANRRIPFYD